MRPLPGAASVMAFGFVGSTVRLDGFITASAHIEQLDPGAEGAPIVRTTQTGKTLNVVLSNSFGFGGQNITVIAEVVALNHLVKLLQ